MELNLLYNFRELEEFINARKPENIFLRVFDEITEKNAMMMTCDKYLLDWYAIRQGILFYQDGTIGSADGMDLFKLLTIIPVLES